MEIQNWHYLLAYSLTTTSVALSLFAKAFAPAIEKAVIGIFNILYDGVDILVIAFMIKKYGKAEGRKAFELWKKYRRLPSRPRK